jgi:hypothetical protein
MVLLSSKTQKGHWIGIDFLDFGVLSSRRSQTNPKGIENP